jgi:hypothetical protein
MPAQASRKEIPDPHQFISHPNLAKHDQAVVSTSARIRRKRARIQPKGRKHQPQHRMSFVALGEMECLKDGRLRRGRWIGEPRSTEPSSPGKHPERRIPAHLGVVGKVIEPEAIKAQPEAWRCIGVEVSEQLDYEAAVKWFDAHRITGLRNAKTPSKTDFLADANATVDYWVPSRRHRTM